VIDFLNKTNSYSFQRDEAVKEPHFLDFRLCKINNLQVKKLSILGVLLQPQRIGTKISLFYLKLFLIMTVFGKISLFEFEFLNNISFCLFFLKSMALSTQVKFNGTIMKVIIFADRDGQELRPLTLKTCVGLLPIAGKPLLEHILDSLVSQKIEEIWLVIAEFADQVKQTLQNGDRWGIKIHYVLGRGQELPADILRRLGDSLQDTEYLMLRGDVLRDIRLREFLNKTTNLAEPIIAAQLNEQDGQLLLIRRPQADWLAAANLLAWNAPEIAPPHVTVEIEGNFARLDSLLSYHQANLDVMQQKFPRMVIPCLQLPNHPKLYVGRCSQAPAPHSVGLVANHCHLHPSVVLENSVIHPYVVIESNTLLRNTIVLSDTYLGKNLTLENLIVWGDTIVDIHTGAITHEANAQLRDLSQHCLHESVEGLLHRGLAVVLVILSLPLWFIAPLVALRENPQHPIKKVILADNQSVKSKFGQFYPSEFESWEWATSIPLLRYLPRLFAVIWGKLRLIGISPELTSVSVIMTNSHTHPPIGLISPAQLSVTTSAEERYLVEIWYAKRRTFLRDMGWLCHAGWACFTKRAWVAERD
jgi:hypothetical protein